MNTFQDLINNGIEPHTAQYMIDCYSKRIGKMSGIYEITDITYDFSDRCRDITLKCSWCGREIHRKMLQGNSKWGKLIKSCPCEKERKAHEERVVAEKIEKEKKDLILSRIGKIYGDYKIISAENLDKNPQYVIRCNKCGADRKISAIKQAFENRTDFHCGNHSIKFDESYIGKKKNFLTVREISRLENGHRCFVCECDCGNFTKIEPTMWDKGIVKSCGCLSESLKLEHTEELDRLRRIYGGMIQRCYNQSSIAYENYGGRGIKICDEWRNSRDKFIEWALNNGYSNDLSIDRIDVNGNYEPSNCRFATIEMQIENRRPKEEWKKPKKRKLKTLTINGETKTLQEWYKKYNTSEQAVRYRMKTIGMSLEQAIQTPKICYGRPRKQNSR